MSNVVSLTEYKAKHLPSYLRGVYIDAWVNWTSGPRKEKDNKDAHNARVLAEYKKELANAKQRR